MGICTECFLQVRHLVEVVLFLLSMPFMADINLILHPPDCMIEMQLANSHDAPPCPVCQTAPLTVTFHGPLPAEERLAAKKERDASKTAEARAQQVTQFCIIIALH